MARATKVYMSAHSLPQPHHTTMWEGELRSYVVEAKGALEGATLSSAAWAVAEGDDSFLTLGSATTSGTTSSMPVTAVQEGYAELKAILTLSDARKLVQWFQVDVGQEGDISGRI